MYDVWQSSQDISRSQHERVQERDKLVQERADLQEWLKHDLQLIDNIQRADVATTGTPRPSAEAVQKIQEKRPTLLESLIPVLIPSINIGLGGGKHKERERERR